MFLTVSEHSNGVLSDVSYGAMVFDGPTTLGLRPQNENLHLEECSEWVQFPYFLQPNTQHQAAGLFRIIFHTSWCRKALMSGGGGGVEGLGKSQRGGGGEPLLAGGHIPLGGGGVLHHKGGVGEVGLWFG